MSDNKECLGTCARLFNENYVSNMHMCTNEEIIDVGVGRFDSINYFGGFEASSEKFTGTVLVNPGCTFKAYGQGVPFEIGLLSMRVQINVYNGARLGIRGRVPAGARVHQLVNKETSMITPGKLPIRHATY